MKNFKPLVFASVLIISIVVFSFLRAINPDLNVWSEYPLNLDILFVVLYLAWMVAEIVFTRRELKQVRNTSDYGTCELYALGQGLTLLSALWFKSCWSAFSWFHVIGLLVFVSGVGFRLWSIWTLGQYYSHIVRQVEEHRIVQRGPYGIIRHPAYAGMIVANGGVLLFFLNWVTTGLFLLLLLPAILLRIFIEEKTLVKIRGYTEYAKSKNRLLPLVW